MLDVQGVFSAAVHLSFQTPADVRLSICPPSDSRDCGVLCVESLQQRTLSLFWAAGNGVQLIKTGDVIQASPGIQEQPLCFASPDLKYPFSYHLGFSLPLLKPLLAPLPLWMMCTVSTSCSLVLVSLFFGFLLGLWCLECLLFQKIKSQCN